MSFLASARAILTSRRLAAVTALSFASGLPLGLVTVAIPAWLAAAGYDIKTVGAVSAAQMPYALKFLWAPLMDRYKLPFLQGKRSWIFAAQVLLAVLVFALALQAFSPGIALVTATTFLIAFTSATQDIAVDAYAVESLEKNEQGTAVGVRSAVYRAAMWLSGALAITVSGSIGWPLTIAALGAAFAALTISSLKAPEPLHPAPPPRSLREAVIEPVLSFIKKPRALEIAAFLLLYKIADNLAIALVRPFLIQKGFSEVDVGVASGSIGLAMTLLGTFLGGLLTTKIGLGRALWICGILQAFGDTGYAAVAAASSPDRILLYAATVLDTGTTGLGTGAFMVLLLRLTARKFSATQYALFSSLFGLGRTMCGPVSGVLASLMGWQIFFLSSVLFSIPGLFLLHRFIPWSCRDLPEELEGSPDPAPPGNEAPTSGGDS